MRIYAEKGLYSGHQFKIMFSYNVQAFPKRKNFSSAPKKIQSGASYRLYNRSSECTNYLMHPYTSSTTLKGRSSHSMQVVHYSSTFVTLKGGVRPFHWYIRVHGWSLFVTDDAQVKAREPVNAIISWFFMLAHEIAVCLVSSRPKRSSLIYSTILWGHIMQSTLTIWTGYLQCTYCGW